MRRFHFRKIIICIFAAAYGVGCGYVPDLSDFNPLKDEGYDPKAFWAHYAPDEELSASVSDWTSTGTDCVRVVVFTAKGAVLEQVTVSCDAPHPFLGLGLVDDVLWFYGKVLVKRISGDTYTSENNKFIVVKANDDMQTCKKTTYVVDWCTSSAGGWDYRNRVKGKSTEPNGVKLFEDPDCTDLINFNKPPMMLMSVSSDLGQFSSTSGWSGYNAWEPVGAMTRTYGNGFECFRLLVLYSYGRPVDSMKMACGPLQGMVLSEGVFYYNRTIMIKPHGTDMNTFTVFINPRNGMYSEGYKKGLVYKDYRKSEQMAPVCIKKTFTLTNEGGRYKKKKLYTEIEYELGQECKDLVEGRFEGATVADGHIVAMLESLYKDTPEVNIPAVKDLKGCKPASKWSDFNLAKDLGAVMLLFKKPNSEMVKAIFVVAKGVVLDAAIVEVNTQTNLLVIRENVLYHDKDIMLKKERDQNKFKVLIKNKDGSCNKNTYGLKTLNGKMVKDLSSGQKVSGSDSDCLELLQEKNRKNPDAAKYNTATSLTEDAS